MEGKDARRATRVVASASRIELRTAVAPGDMAAWTLPPSRTAGAKSPRRILDTAIVKLYDSGMNRLA